MAFYTVHIKDQLDGRILKMKTFFYEYDALLFAYTHIACIENVYCAPYEGAMGFYRYIAKIYSPQHKQTPV